MKLIFLILALSCTLPLLYAGSGKETVIGENLKKGDTVEIRGRIEVKGSEPLTFTVIETPDGMDYEIFGEKGERLRQEFELEMVTIIGEVLSTGDDIRPPVVEVSSYKVAEGA